ncbi:hypothetical protein GCM10027615_30550 [Plantactinospora veratri]
MRTVDRAEGRPYGDVTYPVQSTSLDVLSVPPGAATVPSTRDGAPRSWSVNRVAADLRKVAADLRRTVGVAT